MEEKGQFCYNSAGMQEFRVTIDTFEGPLDLMLHLIKENKLDLMNLDINVLTDQYLAYLNAMQDLHLEIASEYLVELAELVEIKSRKLLPHDKPEGTEEDEEDPKDRLVRRLLEYQQYKEVSQTLGTLYEQRQETMAKPVSTDAEQYVRDLDHQPVVGNPNDLFRAMRRCLMRLQLNRPLETRYTRKEISMEDRELVIRSKLDHLPQTFSFDTLTEDCQDLPTFIATFLAVLDLARQQILVFTVDAQDVIWFSRGTGVSA